MKMNTIGAFDAKTHLSQLLDRVEQGEIIEITRRGHPVARLVPCDQGVNIEGIERLISKVQKERGTYGISSKDIAKWKSEGRR